MSESSSEDANGDLKCAICLDDWEDVAELHTCTHLYCFQCIVRWSETCNQCPQCKRRFYEVTTLDGTQTHEVVQDDSDDSGTTSEEHRKYGGYREDGFVARDDEIEYSDVSSNGGTMSEDDVGMEECEDRVREVRVRRRRPTARQQYRRHWGVDECEHEMRETCTLVPVSPPSPGGPQRKKRLRRRQPLVINLVSDDEEDD